MIRPGMSGQCFLCGLRMPVSPFPNVNGVTVSEYFGLIRLPKVFGFPTWCFGSAYLPPVWWTSSQCTLRQEHFGSPKFLTFLFTHATLFVDPGRPSKNSPNRSLCVGFWAVETIAICVSHFGAVSSFRKCGLPCGLRVSLCTLQLSCSAIPCLRNNCNTRYK